MKGTIKQVFRSPKFLVGFIIFGLILLAVIIYPLLFPGNPQLMIGQGSFIRPGTYVSLYDSLNTVNTYTFVLPDAEDKRVLNKLTPDDRLKIVEWLGLFGMDVSEIDTEDTETLLNLWWDNYDASLRLGRTGSDRRDYNLLDERIRGLLNSEDLKVLEQEPATGEYADKRSVKSTDYVNTNDVANVINLPLGTDNFGMDMFRKLITAIGVSIRIGLIAGAIATFIGLILGLLAGYVGGILDDIIMFFANIFTVIPSFVLLILISYNISQSARGPVTVAIVIGLTSWVWTTRSVRAQVISLRNRDHVSLSKLSGHSLFRIVLADILPYIASYVVMAFILQVSSAILAEAQLSMIGLGPRTTEMPTLGLMMNWGMVYSAHIMGAWWAYYPIIVIIALISFSLNLMNTGLDQVFNPQLRD